MNWWVFSGVLVFCVVMTVFAYALCKASSRQPPRQTDCLVDNMFCSENERYCDTLVKCPNHQRAKRKR